ncbi:MAG TPA: hypothetical protein VJ781_00850, partial [Pyrinomonadaceae bacterium]|nr:hypothetical protein [Pyrinomonadaceae bacterium]
MNTIIFRAVSLRLNVLAVLKILARRDFHQAQKMTVEMALVGKAHQHGSFGNSPSTSDPFLTCGNSDTRLERMGRHPDRSGENPCEVKWAEGRQYTQLPQRNVPFVMLCDVISSDPDRSGLIAI